MFVLDGASERHFFITFSSLLKDEARQYQQINSPIEATSAVELWAGYVRPLRIRQQTGSFDALRRSEFEWIKDDKSDDKSTFLNVK